MKNNKHICIYCKERELPNGNSPFLCEVCSCTVYVITFYCKNCGETFKEYIRKRVALEEEMKQAQPGQVFTTPVFSHYEYDHSVVTCPNCWCSDKVRKLIATY